MWAKYSHAIGRHGHKAVSHKELDEAVEKMWFKPRMVRMPAVKAELTEREREHRDISQEALADISGVAPHNLRKWAEWYRAEGVRVLRARGGQGRKPDASHEGMEAAIENGQEKSGLQSSPPPEAEADNCGACSTRGHPARAA